MAVVGHVLFGVDSECALAQCPRRMHMPARIPYGSVRTVAPAVRLKPLAQALLRIDAPRDRNVKRQGFIFISRGVLLDFRHSSAGQIVRNSRSRGDSGMRATTSDPHMSGSGDFGLRKRSR